MTVAVRLLLQAQRSIVRLDKPQGNVFASEMHHYTVFSTVAGRLGAKLLPGHPPNGRGNPLKSSLSKTAPHAQNRAAYEDAARVASTTGMERTTLSVEPALQIDRLTRRYGRRVALRDVSLTLETGDWLGLIGPNGAGKTTLVRCITGLATPDAGTVRISGAGTAADQRRRLLGYIPQDLALYPQLKLRDNLLAFGRFHGLSGGCLRERVDWALQWIGLAARAGERIEGFSGGMKRRVNIACGVLHRPPVILLDEPSVGVDPQSRDRIFAMLQQLKTDGASILMTTHHLDEVQRWCDRVAILDGGSIIACGDMPTLIRQTLGTAQRVSVTVTGAPPRATRHWRCDAGTDRLTTHIHDVAGELPSRLGELAEAGQRICDIQVEAPSLHRVFVHLTGKELRE